MSSHAFKYIHLRMQIILLFLEIKLYLVAIDLSIKREMTRPLRG